MGEVRASTVDSGMRAMRSWRLARKRGGREALSRGTTCSAKRGLSSLGGPGRRMTILRRLGPSELKRVVSRYWQGAVPFLLSRKVSPVGARACLVVLGG